MTIGAVALGSLALCWGLNMLVGTGLISNPPCDMSAKYWTAFSPSDWTHAIWSLTYLLTAIFLVFGIARSARGNPLPGFPCAATMLIPGLLMNSVTTYLWGKDLIVIPTLLMIGTMLCALCAYCIVMKRSGCAGLSCPSTNTEETQNLNSTSSADSTATPPARTTNSTNTTSTTSTSSSGKCGPTQCLRILAHTLWARIYAPWMIVAAIQFLFILGKFGIMGAVPIVARDGSLNQTIVKKVATGVVHAVADKVAGNSSHIATLTSGEAVGAIVALVGLILVALVFSFRFLDGVPAAVFAWASLGVSCHARTLGTAARLAHNTGLINGLLPFIGRINNLLVRVGVTGVWGLGGKSGEAWWTIIHDVALAAAIVQIVIALVTTILRCRKMKAQQGKTLA